MPLTRIKLKDFTVFKDLDITPSPGINIFIGENGTGKTHLLKVAYSACTLANARLKAFLNDDLAKEGELLPEISFSSRLRNNFLPDSLGRLVRRQKGGATCEIIIEGTEGLFQRKLSASFSNKATTGKDVKIKGKKNWINSTIDAVFIPVKEILSHSPGFVTTYEFKEIHFEEIYRDILLRASDNIRRGPIDRDRKNLLMRLQETIKGKVVLSNDEFYLKNKQGNLEFTLLAEGIRKLGLIWLLIQNGTLQNGSIIFWDEPEANLNPKLIRPLVGILIELQKMGVQVFIATHSYVVVKEFELQTKKDDKILYHSLYFETGDKDKENLLCLSTPNYYDLKPNDVLIAYDKILEDEIKRSL